jgi:hypothetical protein
VRSAQQVGDLDGFFAQGGQADDDRGVPVAPAAHGLEQRHAVVVTVL